MKTLVVFSRMAVMLLAIVMTACSPEDGEDGAVGPIGPQGEQGPPGPQGPQGETGEDGNANVIASDWIPEEFSDVSTSLTSFDVMDTNIDQSILDSGLVLAYGRESLTTVLGIPFTFSNKTYYTALFADGRIRFIGRSVDGSGAFFSDLTDVRYVIIPSSTSSKNAGLDFTKMSYHEVIYYFGLTY